MPVVIAANGSGIPVTSVPAGGLPAFVEGLI